MQSTSNLSPVKDGRRILGDKTPNACLSPARSKHLDAVSDISPVKRSLFENHSPKKLLPSPSFVGQKRTIDQVEADSRINKENVQLQRVEQVEGNHERSLQDKAVTQATAPKYDQQQSDAMPSNDTQSTEPQHSHPQTRRLPLSDIVNLIDTPSPKQTPKTYTRTIPEDPITRKLFIQEKASLLRSRIRSAMRHVRDHQFDRRLSELEAHSRKYPRLSLPALSQQHTGSDPAPRRETAMEATAVLAAAALASTSPSKETPPSLEPALDVELDPTPKNSSDAPAGLSSPPLSAGTTANQEDADPLRTPTQKSFHRRTDTLESPTAMQLSSPPATVSRNGGKRTIDMTDEHDVEVGDEDNKTEKMATLAHKGDAVDGLLQLMNTSDKRRLSVSDTRSG
ncbi:hypothetical protein Asppvi_006622 [Aspergillus pseudoviridinutans]|uniref:Uncharacterized protein n=1 Tax=Aspergillus pseudoviridinutans TaxID=1517512 RepID=A0A9P3BD12_9EURO|nr:uncharacterized protein Asppvi_006622 [Aspergillus pseudoviridinutans]GIJ87709.1 hypothetical protein Asppvi_006622 [Aspergillus pseudoviridinutans]